MDEVHLRLPLGHGDRPSRLGAVVEVGLPVEVVLRTVHVGRPQDDGREPACLMGLEEEVLARDLVPGVATPIRLRDPGALLSERHVSLSPIDGRGAYVDEAVHVPLQGLRDGSRLRRRVGGDVEGSVEFVPTQDVLHRPGIPTVGHEAFHCVGLLPRSPVQRGDLVSRLHEELDQPQADEAGSAKD